jgi:L-serine dehydratase
MIVSANLTTKQKANSGSGRVSVIDLFTIGIGPSSSHTVGPMRAAKRFVEELAREAPRSVTRLKVELFGSLSLTGRGHRTDVAVVIGLLGWAPETIDPDRIDVLVEQVRRSGTLSTLSAGPIAFNVDTDLIFSQEFHPGHPNALTFTSFAGDEPLLSRTFFSVGGGFIVAEDHLADVRREGRAASEKHPFSSGAELLAIGRQTGLSIADIMLENESELRSPSDTFAFLDRVRDAMMACIERGYLKDGLLPGRLKVRRRAKLLRDRLMQASSDLDPLHALDWVSLYALSVNEENAAGGRVVTAPTNGASGVIPAVLKYYDTFCKNPSLKGCHSFLLTAAAIGILYKRRASLSAAEMGCQGEVGVACSMAAAGLTSALGGTNEQIENAAEIGMEHNLGLTCDPIGGLVQVPCIERNTMGALKAINASRLALFGDGLHVVSLDAVIETMRQTGEDMRSKYKETSLGGLAVNVVEC